MTSGVYCLFNSATKRRYVGISKNIEARVQHHVSQMKRDRHYNALMQHDWNNGHTGFELHILEECYVWKGGAAGFGKTEQKWIKVLQPEYNTTYMVFNPNGLTGKRVFQEIHSS